MNKFLDKVYSNQSLIYKILLFIGVVLMILYLFPKGGKFKYEFQKGKPWQYDNLYAPFDFPIYKSVDEIALEKEEVSKDVMPYYNYDDGIYQNVKKIFNERFSEYFNDSVPENLFDEATVLLESIYQNGVVVNFPDDEKSIIHLIKKGNQLQEININDVFKLKDLDTYIEDHLDHTGLEPYTVQLYEFFFEILKPNVDKNENFTSKAIDEALSKISYTRGSVDKDKRIIAKGEVVEGDKYIILDSLKKEYQSQLWNDNNFYVIVFGYVLLISISVLMLILFLRKYRRAIYDDNIKMTFIFFNVTLMMFLATTVVKYDVKYIYMVPLTILPIIIKAFFDARTGLFVHVITILLIGFVVPNSFEYTFLQIIAGIITILTVSELYKRANLFISVGKITLVYIVSYFAFFIIHEGTFKDDNLEILGYFLLNGLMTVVSAQSLIYIYEKIFGLDSDVSLLELSDTNSRLLKELSEKAPGTFHHSLQVANLAEASANEIGANAMLVRVGALYHDIGKMKNPTFFTENQKGSLNPHDELDPEESARIIINHALDGIKIAKKNNLPDRIIDFIRTHHGTSLVYYFYAKAKAKDGVVDEEKFRYKGPIPFSRETAILMMADSVEAASKSIKNPSFPIIDSFVEKIINKQMEEGQFLNANITFKEIEAIKKVLKQKLVNIYHLRIEYPE